MPRECVWDVAGSSIRYPVTRTHGTCSSRGELLIRLTAIERAVAGTRPELRRLWRGVGSTTTARSSNSMCQSVSRSAVDV